MRPCAALPGPSRKGRYFPRRIMDTAVLAGTRSAPPPRRRSRQGRRLEYLVDLGCCSTRPIRRSTAVRCRAGMVPRLLLKDERFVNREARDRTRPRQRRSGRSRRFKILKSNTPQHHGNEVQDHGRHSIATPTPSRSSICKHTNRKTVRRRGQGASCLRRKGRAAEALAVLIANKS